jgi:hypothetical protein
MIEKPEDAIPYDVKSYFTPDRDWFTAKDCADIARAYQRSYFMSDGEAFDWEARFAEWEK